VIDLDRKPQANGVRAFEDDRHLRNQAVGVGKVDPRQGVTEGLLDTETRQMMKSPARRVHKIEDGFWLRIKEYERGVPKQFHGQQKRRGFNTIDQPLKDQMMEWIGGTGYTRSVIASYRAIVYAWRINQGYVALNHKQLGEEAANPRKVKKHADKSAPYGITAMKDGAEFLLERGLIQWNTGRGGDVNDFRDLANQYCPNVWPFIDPLSGCLTTPEYGLEFYEWRDRAGLFREYRLGNEKRLSLPNDSNDLQPIPERKPETARGQKAKSMISKESDSRKRPLYEVEEEGAPAPPSHLALRAASVGRVRAHKWNSEREVTQTYNVSSLKYLARACGMPPDVLVNWIVEPNRYDIPYDVLKQVIYAINMEHGPRCPTLYAVPSNAVPLVDIDFENMTDLFVETELEPWEINEETIVAITTTFTPAQIKERREKWEAYELSIDTYGRRKFS